MDSVIDLLICQGEQGGAPGLCRAVPQLVRPGKAQGEGGNAPSSGKLHLGQPTDSVECMDMVVSRKRGLGPEDNRSGP